MASAIVWRDEVSAVASIEPLGVRPFRRRRGLGRAISLFALSEVRRFGGSVVVVHPRGDAAYPAALATYLMSGFTVTGRVRTFSR